MWLGGELKVLSGSAKGHLRVVSCISWIDFGVELKAIHELTRNQAYPELISVLGQRTPVFSGI